MNRKTGTSNQEKINLPLLTKSTKQYLAAHAGYAKLADLSNQGQTFLEALESHTTVKAVNELIKDELLTQYFSRARNGLTLDTLPLRLRSKYKEKIWYSATHDEDGNYAEDPYIIELRSRLLKQIKQKRLQFAYRRTLNDLEHKGGLITLLGVTEGESEIINADQNNPEIVRLVRVSDADPITILISGKPGAGKTNMALHLCRTAGMITKGYINPQYGNRHRLRMYLPFVGEASTVFPGAVSSFSYRYPWQIFLNEPKGRSVLWTRYDSSKMEEEEGEEATDILSIVYLGEVGTDKLRYAGSKEAFAYKNLFQMTRQMKIRYILSSADPQPIPPTMNEDFINPQIFMDITESGKRNAMAEYLLPSKIIKKIDLGYVPLDPATKRIGKGIASDFTSSIMDFNLGEMLTVSEVTNIQKYLKNPDDVIEAASQYVLGFQEEYEEARGIMVNSTSTPEPVRNTRKPVINDDENTGDNILMP